MSGLPKGWAETHAIEVATPIRGVGYKKEQVKFTPDDGVTAVLRANNIQDNQLVLDDLVYVPNANISQEQRLKKNDIVIAMSSGSLSVVGKSAQVGTEINASFGAFCGALRPKHEIEPRYLGFFLKSDVYRKSISNLAKGSNINNLKWSHFEEISIPLAPLPEQKRIADKLDTVLARVDACRDRLDRIPALLKRFRQSVLAAATSGKLTEDWREERQLSLTTWSNPQIHEIVSIKNGRAFPSKDYSSSGIRLLRPGNLLKSGLVGWTEKNTTHLPEKYGAEFPGYVLCEGELLMNLTAQSLKDEFLGRVCLKLDDAPALLNQRICAFYSTLPYDVRPYLFVYFRSPSFRSFVDTLDSGTLIKHMHTKQLLAHRVPLAPELEQNEIVRRVETLFAFADRLESRYATARKQVEQLTPALLAKAFRGELVAQDPNDEPAAELLKRLAAQREIAPKARRGRKGA